MIDYKIEFADMDWEIPYQGIKHKIVEHNGVKLRLVEYSKDVPLHWCSRGHYGMILEGEMEIEFADKKDIFRKGDGVFIPNGEDHWHRATALTEMVKALFVEGYLM